jgi:hypothetical protein
MRRWRQAEALVVGLVPVEGGAEREFRGGG